LPIALGMLYSGEGEIARANMLRPVFEMLNLGAFSSYTMNQLLQSALMFNRETLTTVRLSAASDTVKKLRDGPLSLSREGKQFAELITTRPGDLVDAFEDHDVFGLTVRLLAPIVAQPTVYEMLESNITPEQCASAQAIATRLAALKSPIARSAHDVAVWLKRASGQSLRRALDEKQRQ
jgi:hypothetical protein